MLPDITIDPIPSTKYLGVFMDQHLNWNTHIVHTSKKGTTWSTPIRRVAAPSWGIPPKYARRMYIAVALPNILYTVDVWGTPKDLDTIADHKRVYKYSNGKADNHTESGSASYYRLSAHSSHRPAGPAHWSPSPPPQN